jgi:hypothetical protein
LRGDAASYLGHGAAPVLAGGHHAAGLFRWACGLLVGADDVATGHLQLPLALGELPGRAEVRAHHTATAGRVTLGGVWAAVLTVSTAHSLGDTWVVTGISSS